MPLPSMLAGMVHYATLRRNAKDNQMATKRIHSDVLPSSALGLAIGYVQNQPGPPRSFWRFKKEKDPGIESLDRLIDVRADPLKRTVWSSRGLWYRTSPRFARGPAGCLMRVAHPWGFRVFPLGDGLRD